MDEGECYFSNVWHKGNWEGKGEMGISPSAHNFESLSMFEEGNWEGMRDDVFVTLYKFAPPFSVFFFFF